MNERAAIALARNEHLATYLAERMLDCQERLLSLDLVHEQEQVLEVVRRMQVVAEIRDEISELGEVAEKTQEPR